MLEVLAIDHIVLRTSKLDKMIAFYTQVIGCSLERETPKALGLTQLRAGSALIDLVEVDSELGAMGGGAPTKTERNVDHFCLQLKPISEAALLQHLEKHGIGTEGFENRYGAQGFGDSIYIKDPEDNTVELRAQR